MKQRNEIQQRVGRAIEFGVELTRELSWVLTGKGTVPQMPVETRKVYYPTPEEVTEANGINWQIDEISR